VDIVQFFDDNFEIVSADTPELKREAFRIRFSVFCEELCLPGNEPWRYPDGLETDAYDEHSAHCLLRYKPTANWVGTVRLVLTPPLDTATPFPVEAAAGHSLKTTHLQGVDRRHLAEISRLILSEPYRHRHDSIKPRTSRVVFTDQRHVQLPLLGLLAATMQLTVDNQITHWLAGIEPPLKRLLTRLGIELRPIGPEISYGGVRRPYFGEVSDVMAKLKRKNSRVWEIICDQGRRYQLPAD
jgi:N-acyl amino acid synthase of PEP-CTERM/exosortase system